MTDTSTETIAERDALQDRILELEAALAAAYEAAAARCDDLMKKADFEVGRKSCTESQKTALGLVRDTAESLSSVIRNLTLRSNPSAPAPVTVQDATDTSFSRLVADALIEAEKAMRKFPQPNYVLLKVAEEAGEVVKEAVHFAEGRATRQAVEDEMRQTIAMLYRLWVEGDEVNGVRAIAGAKP